MRAAYFRGGGRIEYAEVPTPHPGPGEVVIRVAAYDLFGAGEALKVLVEP